MSGDVELDGDAGLDGLQSGAGSSSVKNPVDLETAEFEYKVESNDSARIYSSFYESFVWQQEAMKSSMFRVVMYSRLKGTLHWKLYSAGKSVVSKGERGYE